MTEDPTITGFETPASFVEQLSREEAHLKRQLSKIARDHAQCSRRLANLHNSTESSISRMPIEIVSLIFQTLHDAQPLLDSQNPTADVRSPNFSFSRKANEPKAHRRVEVTLSHVCHRWRSIAIGLPSLWTVFWCHPRPLWNNRLKSEINRLQTYVRRSRMLELDLYIDIRQVPHPYQVDNGRFQSLVSALLAVAWRCSSRWRNFTLVSIWLHFDWQRRIHELSAPKLRRLTLLLASPSLNGPFFIDGEGGWDLTMAKTQMVAPRLEYLKMDRAALLCTRPALRGITHLVLEPGIQSGANAPSVTLMDWPVFIKDILGLPNLEVLSVYDEMVAKEGGFPSTAFDWQSHQLELRRLKHLRLTSARQSSQGDPRSILFFLLRYINAPNLETLTISNLTIGSSLWRLSSSEWLEPRRASNNLRADTSPSVPYPSLQSLALIDFDLESTAGRPEIHSILSCLVHLTSSVRTLIIAFRLIALDASRFGRFLREDMFSRSEVAFWPSLRELSFQLESFPLDLFDSFHYYWDFIYSPSIRANAVGLPAEVVAGFFDPRYKAKENVDLNGMYTAGGRLRDHYKTCSRQRPGHVVNVVPVYREDACYRRHWPLDTTSSHFNSLEIELH